MAMKALLEIVKSLTSLFLLYPRKRSLKGVYWNRPVGWSVHKICSVVLLLQFLPDLLDTCHKC